MTYALDLAGQARLQQFLADLGASHLKDKRKRESFALYFLGLLSESERKSVEPLAARNAHDPRAVQHMHDKLLHFVSHSSWDDRAVRQFAARHAIRELQRNEKVTTWIIDDTGFLKQGKHSVAVQRQYTGSAGKITNCQVGVSLCVATATAHLPLDFELYVPEKWADSPPLRLQAKIPEDLIFKTKPQLALDMIERAVQAEIPGDVLLADAGYGDSNEFRSTVRTHGFDYAVGVSSSVTVHHLDAAGRARGTALSAKALANKLIENFRRVTWKTGANGQDLSARFAFMRVKTAHDDGMPLASRQAEWLIAEWPDSESEPSKFHLTTLPERMSKKQIVLLLEERWRTERMYQDLKGELGLDHFEGRSFTGWHHHVSVVLTCAAFLVAEQARAFPPSTARQTGADSNVIPAPKALSSFHHVAAPRVCASARRMASAMPALSSPELTQRYA